VTEILFPIDDDDILFLRVQWNDLLSSYTSDQSFQDQLFKLVKEKYSESGRFYHNLNHVKQLLNLFESLNNQIQESNAVRFSIWFHDVVYDTERNDNEEESARLAVETLGELNINFETLGFVGQLILATKSHVGHNLSQDGKLFLDLDLAILGMSQDIYEKYSRAIREEYSWVPEQTYGKRRREILEGFLDRETIYFTNIMKDRFEEQARKNIRSEIQSLESQQHRSA